MAPKQLLISGAVGGLKLIAAGAPEAILQLRRTSGKCLSVVIS
jgi:hypothetical protein